MNIVKTAFNMDQTIEDSYSRNQFKLNLKFDNNQ